MLGRRAQHLTVTVTALAILLAIVAALTSCTATLPSPDVPRITIPPTSRLPIGGDTPASSEHVLPGSFVFTVTGASGTAASIAWGGPGDAPMQFARNVPLPWSVTLAPGATASVTLTLQVDLPAGTTGTATCEISRDGKILKRNTGDNGALCTAMVID